MLREIYFSSIFLFTVAIVLPESQVCVGSSVLCPSCIDPRHFSFFNSEWLLQSKSLGFSDLLTLLGYTQIQFQLMILVSELFFDFGPWIFYLLSCELSYASERLFVTCYEILLNVLWSKDFFFQPAMALKKKFLFQSSQNLGSRYNIY